MMRPRHSGAVGGRFSCVSGRVRAGDLLSWNLARVSVCYSHEVVDGELDMELERRAYVFYV